MQLAVLGGSSLLGGGGLFTKVALLGASVAGSMLLNGRKKPVGKMNDLRVSSASYGRGIPQMWGTMRLTGNMFWATDFREEKIYMTQKGKEKTGKKGEKKAKKGKATPVYKYYANFAMGLCEGPVDDILRIWADNNLIYNKYNSDDKDLVGPGFSTQEEDDTSKGSQKSMAGKKGSGGHSGRFSFRFYAGDDQQLPDSFMESQEGAGNVPGYRDLCYLMFEDFALEDFGNRIPTITAEVTSKAIIRPQLMRFENLPAPAVGWDNEFMEPYIFDIQRERLYVGAQDNEENLYIRVYNIITRKEIRRIDFAELMPQTAPHDTAEAFGIGIGSGTRTWTPNHTKTFQLQGVTPQGDLVIYRPEGNYGVLIFMEPQGRIIKSWGRSGNILSDPWNGILTQGGVFSAIGQDGKGLGQSVTIVYSVFGPMHIFDDNYDKIGVIDAAGRRGNHSVGVYGTKDAIYATSTSYGGTDQFTIYSYPLDLSPSFTGSVNGSGQTEFSESDQDEKEIGKWPPVAGAQGNTLILSYFSYIVGANCIGMIIRSIGSKGTGVWLVKMDPITGEILWEKKFESVSFVPGISGFTHPSNYNNTNYTNFQSEDQFYKIDWRQETIYIDSSVDNEEYPDRVFAQYYWSEKDAMVTFVPTVEGSADDYQPAIVYQDRKIQENVSIAQVCLDVATQVGITVDQIDVSDIATQEPLNGYMFEQPTEARSVLEELANCYQFDVVESDYKLIFKMRGGDSIRTIDDDMLGIVDVDFGTDNERIVESIQYQYELPERVTVSYFNPKNDYETGSQYFKRPTLPIPVVATHEHMEVSFNMALLGMYAKRMAMRILYAAWSERTSVEFKLPRDHLDLDPSDTITIRLKDGRNLEVRLTDIETGADMMLACSGVYNYPDSYKHTISTDEPEGLVKQPPRGVSVARPLVYNIPYLSDNDEQTGDNFGYYWGAGASDTGFNYGVLQSSTTDGTTGWETEGFTQLDAIWGYLEGTIPPPPAWNTMDETTVIRLFPAFDWNEDNEVYTWESIPDNEWPNEKNMILVGEEVILFKTAEEQGDGSVLISNLLRGYRGSIDAAYRHVPMENWAIVHGNSINLAQEKLDYVNAERRFLLNTGIPFAAMAYAKRIELTGSTERPLPPGNVRRSHPGSGAVKFDWSRSTRIGGALKNGTGSVPLAEEEEKYHLFVLDAPYDALTWDPEDDSKYIWKSAELSSPTVTLSSGTLSSLGLSATVDIHIVIHQLSNEVGYGLPHGLTKHYAAFT